MSGPVPGLSLRDARRSPRPAPATPAPSLAPALVPLPIPPSSSAPYVAMARVDASGRVQTRDPVDLLGWSRGDALLVTVLETSAVFQRRPDGAVAMTAKPYVVIPAPVRARCFLHAGARVLVAADPAQDVLVVHSPAAVERMLQLFHVQLSGGAQ